MELCTEDWRGSFRISFGLVTMGTQFGLPFICSLFVYLKIIHTLKDRTEPRLATSIHLARRRAHRAKNR